jgi:hypothetical protein
MNGVSRRKFIRMGGAAGLIAVTPICWVPTASASALGVALAVAAVIAGMIAANNRRSTEGILLGAINEKLQVATEQLASLQTAISFLLRDFATLRNDIEEMLRQQAVIEKQNEIKTNINLYVGHLSLRGKYKSDLDWLNASRREGELNKILYDLTKARVALTTSSSAVDPSSALVLAPCALAELNLMNICNTRRKVYDKITFVNTIETYEKHFASINDSTTNESAAWFLADRRASKEKVLAWLTSNAMWAEVSKPAGALHTCVAHNLTSGNFDILPGQGRISQEIKYRETNALDDPAIKSKLAELKVKPAIEDGAFPIRQLIFEPGPADSDVLYETATKFGNDSYLVGSATSVSRTKTPWKYGNDCTPAHSARVQIMTLSDIADAPKHGGLAQVVQQFNDLDRRNLQNSTEWKKVVQDETELSDHIEQFNTDTAKIAYTTEALAAVDASLKTLGAVKRSFQ